MKKGFLYLLLFYLLIFTGYTGSTHTHPTELVPAGHKEIDFIENKGQWDFPARYKAELPGGVMFLTGQGFVYNFLHQADYTSYSEELCHSGSSEKKVRGHAYKVNFLGANPGSVHQGNHKRSYYHNYFIDNNRSQWAGHVGLFGEVYYKEIYKGTDVRIYSEGDRSVKYDFIVKAGNDPSQIALSFDGVVPELDKEGNLHIQTSVNEIIEQAPYTYQVIGDKKVTVQSRYKYSKGILSFEFPEGYNTAYDLIIDPILVFASFSGGTGATFYAHSTTFDLLGNTYSAAQGNGPGWPTTTGAYQTNFPGSTTAVISKINPTGSALVYATYFGGVGGVAQPNTLRVNDRNELFMAGCATTPSLPVTDSAYQRTRNGSADIYIVHFSENGSSLLGSTYIGGTGLEASLSGGTNINSGLGSGFNPVELAFDRNGSVWVTSNTGSTNFPVTGNALQSTLAGSHDAVIFNLSADCSQLLYSTYFGGTGWDGGITIEIDNNDQNVLVAGYTTSGTLPNTTGGLNNSNAGGTDGFVTKLNKTSLTNTVTTFLGTANNDYAQRLAFDSDNNIYVSGQSLGGTYPVTPGTYSIANANVFIQKLDPDMRTSLASTKVGSSASNVMPSAMIVDICGNILLATIGSAQYNLPITEDAFDTARKPFWFCALRPDFTDLYFGSYFGSTSDHFHSGVARMDPNGIVYHSVCAAGDPNTINFPTTDNSFAPKKLNGSTNDNITFKFNFEATGVQSNFVLDPIIPQKDTGCAPFDVHFKNVSSTAKDYVWDFGDGSPTTTDTNVSHTFQNPGTYRVTLYANNDTSCVTADTSYMDIVVLYVEAPNIDVSDTILCHYEQQIDIGVTINNPSPNHVIAWGPTAGILTPPDQPVIRVDLSVDHTYYVTVKDTIPGICVISTTDTVYVDLSPRDLRIITNDTVVCEGYILPIVATSTEGYTYRWTPATGVNDTTALEPEITILQPEVYTLTASYPGCLDTTVAITVDMHFIPQVNVGPDKSVCQGTEVALESDVTPFRNDYTYQWSPDEQLNTPDGPNADFIADSSGTYVLMVTTSIGCTSSDTLRVTVYPGGFGSAASDTGLCPRNEVELWADGGISYAWTPAYGLSDATVPNPVASPGASTQYTVYITDVHNCVDSKFVFVQVYPDAILTLPDSVSIYPGEQYQIEPGTNCYYFQWFPPSGLNNTEIANPLASPEVRTRYFVTASTEYGCTLRDSIDILVEETIIDMPNAFTPTGGYNTFKPSKRGIAQLKSFTIYNRWGTKVFSTTNIEEGWDGTYNGNPQPLGVYVYTIEAITDSGRVFVKQGNVTLVK